jgi:hypothetical protein
MKGNASNKRDGAERADLLCFLITAQLIAHASTGDWLRTDHVVEASRMWMTSNSAECDWLERAELARMSTAIASQFLVFPIFRDAREVVKFIVDGWRLDYRSPTVLGMPDVCTEHLRQGSCRWSRIGQQATFAGHGVWTSKRLLYRRQRPPASRSWRSHHQCGFSRSMQHNRSCMKRCLRRCSPGWIAGSMP